MPTAAKKKLKARVRMYRLALGDCFLLSFGPAGAKGQFKFHLLIDCGTLKGSPRADALPDVIGDISKSTGGKLNAVAVTHEHWDHLSGFVQHRNLFDKFTFESVWLPWTEDPHDQDPVARQLRERFEPGLQALGLAASADPAVESLLGFYGFDSGTLAAAGKISVNTRQARDYVLSLKPATQPFLAPGNVFEPMPGLRVYVLGPPRSRKQISRDSPRAGETYELAAHAGLQASLGAALRHRFGAAAATGPDADNIDSYFPFDRRYRAETAEEQSKPQFGLVRQHYAEEPYRRIDDDWLAGAAELALQMDSDTNNASLVLAFELVASGKVLLFPGDAQVGNWESWHDVEFKVKDEAGGNATKKVTAEDLLRRTVLYKVGHHGSHNATRKPGGLESMTSRDLVAMIPTDAEFALGRRPHAWHMPAAGLGAALEEKTEGRVLRADSEFPRTAAQKKKFPGRVNVTDLFVEYEIEG